MQVTISIVSHGHDELVQNLVSQLASFPAYIKKVILTHNIEPRISFETENAPFEIVQICNKNAMGFGANHNQAFEYCHTNYFCVMNPDIMLDSDPFSGLLNCASQKNVAIVAPRIVNTEQKNEDSARYFPTPWGLLKKIFGNYDGIYPMVDTNKVTNPDWVAGMFMLINTENYRKVLGFDESFFLYYEDVDLCARVWEQGYKVALCPQVSVVHDARRESHRNFRFLKWHINSAMRFFIRYLGKDPRKQVK